MNTKFNARHLHGLVAGAALLAFSSTGWAQLSDYTQDFEGLDAADTAALTNDGWQVFGNVFDGDTGDFLFGYGPFGAPNDGAAFSAIVSGEGDVPQGAQQLSVFSDYNNTGSHGAGDLVESSVFQEQTIQLPDAGTTYVFTWDHKPGNIELGTTAVAFIKTLDPTAGFFVTNNITADMTAVGPDWGTSSLSITITSDLVGQILQFGYASTATNFEGSGVFYDNVKFELDASNNLVPYAEDFEALDIEDTAALGDAGWLVFGNVFDGDTGDFLFGYGPFPAPNDGAAFSAIVTGEGGAEQGDQQLSVFSDYNNTGAHGAGDLVESNVFQEWTITGQNAGQDWTFSFEAKRGNIEGATTAIAFIKTLDPNAGFALTNFVMVDMTTTPADWTPYELTLGIDAGLAGQLIQVGFSSTASNFEGSGIFYDNLSFSFPDADSDGIDDGSDNCVMVFNPLQDDTNGDGIGNSCDADTTNDCVVNFLDLGAQKEVFFMADPDNDLTGGGALGTEPDGTVNFLDLGVMKSVFFADFNADNPSGVPNDCDGS